MDEFKPVGDLRISGTLRFTEDYKTKCFQLWYNAGKLTAADLYEIIPIPETNFGKKPSVQSLTQWIHNDFVNRSVELDKGVQETMNKALVAAKVEMLQRHITTARRMEDIAMEYLEGHKDDLTTAAAVRLLVEGVRIERESTGIPGMLDKMSKKSDEELLEMVKQLVQESPVDFERIEEENDD